MLEKYPEIIEEVIKKAKFDELRHFNLSSFMSDKPLEEIFEKIDRSMEFFSVCQRTFSSMTATIVLSFIEKKKACGSTFLIWLAIFV